MSAQIETLLQSYRLDVESELDVSPFEYEYTFKTRDFICDNYKDLSESQKASLKLIDKNLFSRTREFHSYLLPIKAWGNSKPIKYWWRHLDKIISNELKVDFEKEQLIYNYSIFKLYES